MFTSFEVDDDKWREFGSKVNAEKGSRNLGHALNIFIYSYLEGFISLSQLESKLKEKGIEV